MAPKNQTETQSPRERFHSVGMDTSPQDQSDRMSLGTAPKDRDMTTEPPKASGAMPTPSRRPDGMKKRPLEVADLALQVLALVLIALRVCGVDAFPALVELLAAVVALVVKFLLMRRGE